MHAVIRLFAVGLCAAATMTAQAQVRKLQPAPNPVPSSSARAGQSAPAPSGLRPVFPAGITSGSGALTSTDPVAASTAPLPGTFGTTGSGTGTVANNSGVTLITPPELVSPDNSTGIVANGVATNVMGAGATVRGPGQTVGGAGGFSATDVARSFFFADANKDGDLTRAEYNRLSIRSMTFEEMDRNFDGVITRFEYDDSLR